MPDYGGEIAVHTSVLGLMLNCDYTDEQKAREAFKTLTNKAYAAGKTAKDFYTEINRQQDLKKTMEKETKK